MPPISVMKKPKDAKGAIKRMLKYLAGDKAIIAVVLLLSVTANILALYGPSLAGNAIHEAEAGIGLVNFERVYYYAGQMALFYAISSVLTVLINLIMIRVSKNVARRMRSDIFSKLMKLPVSFFDVNQAGDIISRVSYDVDVVSTCLATDIVQILTSIVTVVGALVMMLIVSPLMSVVVLFTIPISVLYTIYMRRRTQPRFSKRSKTYGRLNSFVEEMLAGQKTITAYAYADKVNERFDSVNKSAADAYNDAEYYGCTIGPTMSMINNSSLGLIAIAGSLLYMGGIVSLGKISSFVLYSRKFSGPINEIANIVNELFSALAAAERVFNLLDEQEESKDIPEATELTNVKGRVTLDHVSFGYEEGKTILHDLSINADPGKVTAIVGPTGAGKTTIINLLMRFYDTGSGRIMIDGQNIRGLTRKSLRSAYAMVLQDTWLFKGTIYENISYGKPGATREEVVNAAKAAHIHSFIMRLPEGYNTMITEDGGNISKGQKQLLTIARAMLYNAKMLILDEATSNVDTGTERQVQKAMTELMKGKTCFVIAHRLSTIRNADNILVVDHGDVVEQGTHDELIAKKGFYYSLYASQFA